jgi:hypothetical protein
MRNLMILAAACVVSWPAFAGLGVVPGTESFAGPAHWDCKPRQAPRLGSIMRRRRTVSTLRFDITLPTVDTFVVKPNTSPLGGYICRIQH